MPDAAKPNRFMRSVRRILGATLTLGVVAGAGGAVLFGSEMLFDRAEARVPVQEAQRIPVAVTELMLLDGYTVPREFVGQVEAASNVALSFELAGQLSEILVAEGELVETGQILARLDTSLLVSEQDRLLASRAATQAQLDFAEARLERASALREDGFASQEAVEQALASRDELASRIQEIEAALGSVAINFQKSVLTAPFDGRVAGRAVDGGETLAAGSPVLTLVETAAPQVRVGLPLSVDLTQLQDVTVRIGGTSYEATLDRVRPDIDPMTRTRTALFTLATDAAMIFGRIAVLELETDVEETGTWVPLDALQEGAGGVWTVLVVEEGAVGLAAVEILYSTGDRAYVRGSFANGAQMIATGAHRVVPGQIVEAFLAAE